VSEMLEEVPDCPLCGGAENRFLFIAVDRLHRLPGEFPVVECSACTLIRLRARPSRSGLTSFYPSEHYYSYQAPASSMSTIKARSFSRWIRDGIRDSVLQSLNYRVPPLRWWQRLLQRPFAALFRNPAVYGLRGFPPYVESGRALDVGCGNGSYLSYLKYHGWDVAGIEISDKAAKVARNTFGIDVFVGELGSAPWSAGSFDFISISHVVEHVADPVALLSRAAELLKEDGAIYVETPNTKSVGFRRWREYWLHLDAPRHLVLFSPDTIRLAAAHAGLVVRALKTFEFRNGWSWAATFRREDQENRELSTRPMITARTRVGDALQNLEARARNAGDVLGVWLSRDVGAIQQLRQRATG